MTAKSKSSKPISKKNLIKLANFVLFAAVLFIIPAQNRYFDQIPQDKGMFVEEQIPLPTPPPIPVKLLDLPPPYLSAESVLIKDITSGVVMFDYNSDKKLPSASTTKIMTALVSFESYALDDILTVKTPILEGRNMGLFAGEEITMESLLYGALVHSANDAAQALADNYEGGSERFIEKMNEKAKDLYLENTHFTNPIGFDNPQHYTTAKDLAKLALYAMKNKILKKIVSTKAITVSDATYTYFYNLTNVNELLGKVAGVAGVKTGYTQNAGEILISEVQKNGQSVLFVVLKSLDRFSETERLIEWVFQNFTWKPFEQITPILQHHNITSPL